MESKKNALVEHIQHLENQIHQQAKAYKELLAKFEELNKNSGNSNDLHNAINDQEESKIIQELQNLESQVKGVDNSQYNSVVLPVIVFSCNRPDVRRSLDGLLKYRPDAAKFPIIVSQDCGHTGTADIIRSYGTQVTHIQQPDLSEPANVPPNEMKFKGYFKIARHYLWGLKQIFQTFNHSAVIIVEDDLDIAPDFFSYFSATYDLLLKDPTLWCVSAWNDNGKARLIDVEKGSPLLYRSDFFPGLGWMITKKIWDELESKWPRSYWDDWMRRPEQRKERACIRPEISRTRTFGKIGVSNGLFFDKHLKYIKLNENPVDFQNLDLTYLTQQKYDETFLSHVYSLPVVSAPDVRSGTNLPEGDVRLQYHTKDAFKNIVRLLGLMDDFKSGVPRTAYHGIVSFFYNGRRIHLAPNANWKGYDLTWS
nr:EOG090X06K9 [Macrothrix elegans]